MNPLLFVLVACTPTFPETRTDLAGFRVVAAGVRDGALAVAAWSGAGPWFDAPLQVAWSVDGSAVDAAPAPTAPFTATAVVRSGDRTESLVLDVTGEAAPLEVIAASRVGEGTDWALSLDVPGAERVRWMSDAGEILPTGPASGTFLAEGVDAGIHTVFALALDDRGGVAWTWFDVAVGDVGPAVTVGNRILRVDVVPEAPGPWTATLERDDSGEGYRLAGLEPAGDVAGDIGCASAASVGRAGGTLDPEALVDGRCGRDEGIGARVRVEGAAW